MIFPETCRSTNGNRVKPFCGGLTARSVFGGLALLIFTLFTGGAGCATAPEIEVPTGPAAGIFAPVDYELAFEENFDGDALDTERWFYRADAKHRSVQRAEQVSVQNGAMVLTLATLRRPVQTKRYAGGGIVSRERFGYGYYETRASLGDGRDDDRDGKVDEGWHHAFWAMAAHGDENGHVQSTYPRFRRTEIDGYEIDDRHDYRAFTQHVIIWNQDGRESGRRPVPPADHVEPGANGGVNGATYDPTDWNVYGFLWTPEAVYFYVNGRRTAVAPYPASEYEHDALNVWLTAIAANWCDADPEKSVAMYDYFRYYQPGE